MFEAIVRSALVGALVAGSLTFGAFVVLDYRALFGTLQDAPGQPNSHVEMQAFAMIGAMTVSGEMALAGLMVGGIYGTIRGLATEIHALGLRQSKTGIRRLCLAAACSVTVLGALFALFVYGVLKDMLRRADFSGLR